MSATALSQNSRKARHSIRMRRRSLDGNIFTILSKRKKKENGKMGDGRTTYSFPMKIKIKKPKIKKLFCDFEFAS
jgi:hypothetical protein